MNYNNQNMNNQNINYNMNMGMSDNQQNDVNKSHYSHSVNYNKLNRDIQFDNESQELLTIAVHSHA